MSILFKFRSSRTFDTMEIGNRSSIAVRELREKILRGKSSQQGFDLVFSDADTGLEYGGDDSRIQKGSSVIVKRVPVGSVPSPVLTIGALKNDGMKESQTVDPTICLKGTMDEFDLLAADFCMIPDSNLPLFDMEIDASNDEEGITGLRLEDQKHCSSDMNLAIPRGYNKSCDERNILEEARADELQKLNKLSASNATIAWQTAISSNMKCSICNSFFKEAVLMPCCHHSFCDKCIRAVLQEERRCPKCFSNKYTIKDLLPNVSLDQTIQHFRQAGLLDAHLYMQGGESEIQAKELSCGLSVAQNELVMPQSSYVMGSGSNQAFLESYYERKHPRIAPYGDSAGDRSFFIPDGYKEGVRNCYTCGSPNHLMRDCPILNPDMVQPGRGLFHGSMPGYMPPYWDGSSVPHFRPYTNVYRNPSLMPFNGSMVPVSSYVAPPYVPPMCDVLPGPSGNIRMGNMGPPRYSELFGLQQCENRRKHSDEDMEREQHSDNHDGSSKCYRCNSPKRWHDYGSEKSREPSLSDSGDSFNRRPGKQNHNGKYVDSERHEKSLRSSDVLRGKRPYHAEGSSSGRANLPKSSDRHSDGGHKYHHGESKNYNDRRGRTDSDSSFSNHSTEKDTKRKVENNVRGSHKRPHSSTESGVERGAARLLTGGGVHLLTGGGAHLLTGRGACLQTGGGDIKTETLDMLPAIVRNRDKHCDDRRYISSGSHGDRRGEYPHQRGY